MITYLLTY